MKKSCLILLLALSSCWSLALPSRSRRKHVLDSDDTCEAEVAAKTKSCLTQYYDFFGFNATLPPYVEYRKAFETIFYGFGTQGPSIACNYVMFSFSCLGFLIKTEPCITPEQMAKMFGLGKADALSYASDFLMRIDECSSADQLISNFACLKDVYDKKQNELAACSAPIDGGSPNCEAYDKYVTCLTKIYVSACGEGIRSLACNIAEASIFFSVGDDECMQDCPE